MTSLRRLRLAACIIGARVAILIGARVAILTAPAAARCLYVRPRGI